MTKGAICQQLTACLVIFVVLLFSLSACGADASAKTSGASTPIPTSTVSATLVNQGDMQLQTFEHWIALMRQYNGDVTTYQKQYEADKKALNDARTDKAYNDALTTLSSRINTIKLTAMRTEAGALHQKLADKLSAWRSQHTYHNDYDGKTYQYAYEYADYGIVGDTAGAIDTAQTAKELQQIVEDLHAYLANFQAMTENANDTTPYNQPHKTDTDLMRKYGDMQGTVVVVSLYEQAMRVYTDGQLVKSFLVTTGTLAHPSLPGVWWVGQKESPAIFKSIIPEGQPGHYPDTRVNYAMLYHIGGYNIHDSWWRNEYGPGTQFPHADSSGNQSAYEGSHGCINVPSDHARWLYGYVDVYTPVIVY
jgi:hypothetical protein